MGDHFDEQSFDWQQRVAQTLPKMSLLFGLSVASVDGIDAIDVRL